jgi:F0F1-type ATP synthase membrane subunit c/vacuolar-type H+-ATPase subunit K
MRDSAMAAAGVAVGLGAVGQSAGAGGASVNTSRILNYNPNMEYRRQGKTNLMVSAVCLGGHSKSNNEERYEIVSRCIDAGINYIDACTRKEVLRDSKALRGRRDKMYLALSHCGHEVREEDYRTARKLLEVLDGLLKESNQEYTDLWRITCYEPGGRHVSPVTNRAADIRSTQPARLSRRLRRPRSRVKLVSLGSHPTIAAGSSS